MNNQIRHIGQDETRLASVGIGAMSFSNFYGPCNDEQADSILTAAIDLGLNHIDTSNVYGMGVSEQRIGSFLAKQGRLATDFFHIATKAGICRDPDTGVRSFNNEASHLESELDKSLVRMGIEHVDLVISGLPFNMPEGVKIKLQKTLQSLTTMGTTMRWFTYFPWLMKKHYRQFNLRRACFVFWNFPPMWIYTVN